MQMRKASLARIGSRFCQTTIRPALRRGYCNHPNPTYITQQTRSARNVSKTSNDALLPLDMAFKGRPRMMRPLSKRVAAHRTYWIEVLRHDSAPKLRAGVGRDSDWWLDCKFRLMNNQWYRGQDTKVFWNQMYQGCVTAMAEGMDPKDDANARMMCARDQPAEYDEIYQTSHAQADAMYILGRTQLERESKFHKMGWYILSVSAEMGQLDAAILLHRLERVDSSLTAGAKARSLIQHAAQKNSDWRAVMAYVEMEVLDKAEAKRSVQSVGQSFRMLRSLVSMKQPMSATIIGGPDLEPLLHPDSLEEYVPPCRYLWRVVYTEHDKILSFLDMQELTSNRFWLDYATALYEDATVHQNPSAMYELTKLPQNLGYAQSRPGSHERRSMLEKASIHVREACYTLIQELCEETDLLPTLKARERSHSRPSRPGISLTDQQQHVVHLIVDLAQRYHKEHTTVEAYLYLLAGGLLHDNGWPENGRRLLETAIPQLKETSRSADDPNDTSIELIEGLLVRWASYDARGLYASVRPEAIILQLDRLILQKEGEAD